MGDIEGARFGVPGKAMSINGGRSYFVMTEELSSPHGSSTPH